MKHDCSFTSEKLFETLNENKILKRLIGVADNALDIANERFKKEKEKNQYLEKKLSEAHAEIVRLKQINSVNLLRLKKKGK